MKNKQIKINLPSAHRQYDIVIGNGLLKPLIQFIKKQDVSHIVIITDSKVRKLYGDKLLKDLKNNIQYPISNIFHFSHGEKSKTQKIVTHLHNEMFKLACSRDTLIIALGGGVVGDVAGYVASTYMRGISYIQIPTTLLAMVDSSVGGKTGIDTKYGKNLIGSFWQPVAVFITPGVVETLPRKHIINGLLEAIKMFLTHDIEMFEYVRKNIKNILDLDLHVLEKIITRAVEIKARVVMRDEREKGERSILNFGHTIGHAIEKLSKYELMHGEAVGLGMLVEARISMLMGVLDEEDYIEIENFLKKILDIKILGYWDISAKGGPAFGWKDILREIRLDKKAKDGEARFVLLKGIGEFYKEKNNFVHSVDEKIIKESL